MDALNMRMAPTWYAERDCNPIFISINELPQIREINMNSNQPVKLLPNFINFCKGYFLSE